MHHFSIRDVENISGIKAHTLRMWEHRYGFTVCKRKESQHRYYDNEDLKHILRIAYLYHHGYRISQIAQLSQDDVIRLASRRFENDEYEVMVNQLVEASMDYNQEQFESAFHNAIRVMGLESSMQKVIYPFLDKIGLLWITNHVLPAQEHFCSHLIRKTIIAAINALPSISIVANRVLLFTPEGENHELPILFVQYIIKKKGVQTIFLGKSVTPGIIQQYCAYQPATHLYFHLVTNLTYDQPARYLTSLAEMFPDKQIIGSGPALKEVRIPPPNVVLLRSLQEVLTFDFSL